MPMTKQLSKEEVRLYNQQQAELHNILEQMKFELETKEERTKDEIYETFLGRYGFINRLVSLVFNPTFKRIHGKVQEANEKAEAESKGK